MSVMIRPLAQATAAPLPTSVSPAPLRGEEHLGEQWPQRILVGSSGSASAGPALRVARALAERSRASVELLAVFVPSIPDPHGPAQALAGSVSRRATSDRVQAAQLLRGVREQRDALVRSGPVWPMRFESGDPPHVITRVAHEKAADLVVVGIGRPDPRERRQGNLIPAVAALHLDVPVYAAAAGADALPSRVLVFLPDDGVNEPVLRAAAACVRPASTLWIARAACAVTPEIDAQIEAFVAAVRPDHEAHVLQLAGPPLNDVLALAAKECVDLIVVPIRGTPGAARSLFPNYADPLLLMAGCSVLVVPDRKATGANPC